MMSKKSFMTSILLLFSLSLQAANSLLPEFSAARVKEKPQNIFQIKRNVSLIRRDDLMKTLRAFVKSSRPGRMVGSEGHEKARQFLLEAIKELDPSEKNVVHIDAFKPDVEKVVAEVNKEFEEEVAKHFKITDENYQKAKSFRDSFLEELKKRKDVQGKNIVWEKSGRLAPQDILVIGAHYDTMAYLDKKKGVDPNARMPGADDNGSGVAIALSLIRILSHMEIPKTVRVVFFDWEEFGQLGSRAFVEKYKTEFKDKNFVGFLNLDMLGHDSKERDKEKDYGNFKAYIRRPGQKGHNDDKKLIDQLNKRGEKFTRAIDFEVTANGFEGADHNPFWQAGLPAVMLTENWQTDFNGERVHSSDDFVETLNSQTFYKAYQFIAGAVGSWCFDMGL